MCLAWSHILNEVRAQLCSCLPVAHIHVCKPMLGGYIRRRLNIFAGFSFQGKKEKCVSAINFGKRKKRRAKKILPTKERQKEDGGCAGWLAGTCIQDGY